VVRLFSFLIDRAEVPVSVEIDGRTIEIPHHIPNRDGAAPPAGQAAQEKTFAGETVRVPLIALAYGRSGDKGDIANVSLIARRSEFVEFIRAGATADAVRNYMRHFVQGDVERFEWPGLMGFNFLLHRALGGGGVASLRHDPQGKSFAQILLDLKIAVPAAWIAPGGLLADWRHDAERGHAA